MVRSYFKDRRNEACENDKKIEVKGRRERKANKDVE